MEKIPGRWSLQGKSALVTGSTRGIGKAIVEELLVLGASVYICARSEQDVDERLKEWKSKGYTVGGSTCDATSKTAREDLIKKATEFFGGKLDILVNNVGGNEPKPINDISLDSFQQLIALNLEQVFHLSQLAYPYLKASGNGCFVSVSSLSGITSVCGTGVYSMAKAAINQHVRLTACEWARDGIRVNGVIPGFINTDALSMVKQIPPILNEMVTRTPLSRLGEPHEPAATVAFLCLPAAAFITGELVVVDGGISVNSFCLEAPPV